jgi:tetratricopeptide (TPR) repeat protein
VSEKVLRLHDEEKDPAGYVSALHNHYLIERDLGHPAAKVTLRRCGVLAKKHGLQSETVRAVMAKGNVAWDRGNWTRTIACFRQALQLAEMAGITTAASDCRYNLALVLRRVGRAAEALRHLSKIHEPQELTVDQMHRASLAALLIEDLGKCKEAAKAWKRAAGIASALEEREHETYYRTRAYLLRRRNDLDGHERARLADRADELLMSIYASRGPEADVQRRFDAARKYFEQNGLVHYRVRAFRAVADRLTEQGRAEDLVAAAHASVGSMIMAAPDMECVEWAAEGHVQWLLQLSLSKPQLRELRAQTRTWLTQQLHCSADSELVESLLSAFDAVIDPAAYGIPVNHKQAVSV